MTAPKRIQYGRGIKGWKMPAGSVYIGRPSRLRQDAAWFADPMSSPPWGRWGNPFLLTEYDRDEAVRLHREWVLADPEKVAKVQTYLPGKDLVCWCRPGESCHGDTLLWIANGGPR